MYRAIFLVILCCCLLGINTYGWRSSGVNHVLIFELDPRDNLTHQQLLEVWFYSSDLIVNAGGQCTCTLHVLGNFLFVKKSNVPTCVVQKLIQNGFKYYCNEFNHFAKCSERKKDPTFVLHWLVFQISGMFSVIWAVSLLCYLFSSFISIPEFASPLCLVGFCFLYLINPIRIFHYKARMWLLRILVRTDLNQTYNNNTVIYW